MAKASPFNVLDRIIAAVSPRTAFNRAKYRSALGVLERHFEAAAPGRRTINWNKNSLDANRANGPGIATLRGVARDLVRNNGWAAAGVRSSANNVIGWGITASVKSDKSMVKKRAQQAWNAWAKTTQCDWDGNLNLYGLQHLAARMRAESGEVLIRRRRVEPQPGLAIPLKLQILEPDFIDTAKDMPLAGGGRIIQGVEFDAAGRRVAYWLFENHPGAMTIGSGSSFTSNRVDAADIAHIYRVDRAGQVRGFSDFAPVTLTLKDFDEWEDATLLRQKMASCFAVFVKDIDGATDALGQAGANPSGAADDAEVDTLEPGMIEHLPPGRDVSFANPPGVEEGTFTVRQLRRVAAGLGVTYEQLTGDYSGVNFSSARMARLEFYATVNVLRWNVFIPKMCDPIFGWAMEQLLIAGVIAELPEAVWTAPPMPMIEPDKEGLAIIRNVRGGIQTFQDAIRERGFDPEEFLDEYQEGLAMLDKRGIVFDSDARKVSQAGLTQARPGGSAMPPTGEPPTDAEDTAPAEPPAGGAPPGPAKKRDGESVVYIEKFKPVRTSIDLRRNADGTLSGTIGETEFVLTRNADTGQLEAEMTERA